MEERKRVQLGANETCVRFCDLEEAQRKGDARGGARELNRLRRELKSKVGLGLFPEICSKASIVHQQASRKPGVPIRWQDLAELYRSIAEANPLARPCDARYPIQHCLILRHHLL